MIGKIIKSRWRSFTQFLNEKKWFNLVKEMFGGFADDGLMNKSAAIAFYTIFSLPPLLFILFLTISKFYTNGEIDQDLFAQLGNIIGESSQEGLQEILSNTELQKSSIWATIISLGVIIFGATTVFITMQDGLNAVWKVRPKPNKGLIKMLKDRLLSFSLVIGIAFLLFTSMVFDTVLIALHKSLLQNLPDASVYLVEGLGFIISLSISTLLFILILKVLPDVKLGWRQTFSGALFTSLMIFLGKYIIAYYLSTSSLGSAYGAAGAIVLLLIWIYYISAMLLLGAEFTKVYNKIYLGNKVHPSKYAVRFKIETIEQKKEETKNNFNS